MNKSEKPRRSALSDVPETHFVRPDTRAFLDFLNNMPGPKTHEMTPDAARGVMRAMREVADAPVGELALIRDLSIPGPAGAIPARLYDARDSREPGPALLYFHGGGFVFGDLHTHEPFCAEAARLLDMPVIAGDSAGGNLTVVTTMALRDAPAEIPVIAQFPIYPVVDQVAKYESFAQF